MPLQTLPSPQAMPLMTGLWRQPEPGSQVSFVQGFPSSQFTGLLVHRPEAHRSWVVQALASAQSASTVQQPGIGRLRQPFGAVQVSVVQGLPSLHARGWPG